MAYGSVTDDRKWNNGRPTDASIDCWPWLKPEGTTEMVGMGSHGLESCLDRARGLLQFKHGISQKGEWGCNRLPTGLDMPSVGGLVLAIQASFAAVRRRIG